MSITYLRGTAWNSGIAFDHASANCTFKDCNVYGALEDEDNHVLVRVLNATGISGRVVFDNCLFQYTSDNLAYKGTAVMQAVDPTNDEDCIIIKDCIGVTGTQFDNLWSSDSVKMFSINVSSPSEAGYFGKTSE